MDWLDLTSEERELIRERRKDLRAELEEQVAKLQRTLDAVKKENQEYRGVKAESERLRQQMTVLGIKYNNLLTRFEVLKEYSLADACYKCEEGFNTDVVDAVHINEEGVCEYCEHTEKKIKARVNKIKQHKYRSNV